MDSIEQTDSELVLASIANPNNYAGIIDRYSNALDRYICRLGVGRIEDREDLLQEIFLKTYLNLNDYDTDLKFSSWIYRIAHNETMSFFRKKHTRPKTISTDDIDEAFTIDTEYNLINIVDNTISQKRIFEMIYSLEEKYREVVILHYFEEKRYDEIADILKKPPGTVATLLARAKAKLKTLLTEKPL